MYKKLRNGMLALAAAYSIGCSSNPAPRNPNDANDDVQETVRVSHEEEVIVTTRREVMHEQSREQRVGNRTDSETNRTTNTSERRLRTIDRQEGEVSASSRNLNLDLEGLVSGISHGSLSKRIDNDNAYLEIAFAYRGNRFVAALVDFADEMVGGLGNHVCDYFTLSLERGRSSGYFMRVNFSDAENIEFRQNPHSASLKEYVPVGNVIYKISFEGGSGSNRDLSNEDIMRLVDTARSRVESQGYQ